MLIGQICSVVREMDWAAQASLGEVLIPDAIKSSNGDFEKQEKLTKLVSDFLSNNFIQRKEMKREKLILLIGLDL